MEVSMYVFGQGEVKHAATREMMAQLTVPAIRTKDDGTEEEIETALDTDEKIEAAFPGGEWHKASFRDNVLGGDKISVDAKCWVKGEYQPWRRSMLWVLELIQSWTWPAVPNEASFRALPEDCSLILEAAVMNMRESFSLPKNFKMP